MMSLIPPLNAAGGAGGGAVDLLQFVPLVLVFLVMYFFFIRTQQKKERSHKELMGVLKPGDVVVTQSGLIGKVTALVDEQEILLSLAPDCEVRFMKTMVVRCLDKKEPKKVRTLEKERKKTAQQKKTPSVPKAKKKLKA